MSPVVFAATNAVAARTAGVATLRATCGGVRALVNPNHGPHKHEGYALGGVLLANRHPPAALVALGGRHLRFGSVRIFAMEHVLAVVAAARELRFPVDDHRLSFHRLTLVYVHFEQLSCWY